MFGTAAPGTLGGVNLGDQLRLDEVQPVAAFGSGLGGGKRRARAGHRLQPGKSD